MLLKDSQMLRQFMDYKRMTIRQLALEASVSRATVGHLHSGARKSGSRRRLAVEEALGAPPEVFFDPALLVSREVGVA